MTRKELLLIQLAEECSEVVQRVSKALRFGLDEQHKDLPLDNANLIVEEVQDLLTVYEVLVQEKILPEWDKDRKHRHINNKCKAIEKYLEYSFKVLKH